jgi:uncharacterized glyoxalase superfamily protein PhnB
VDDIYPVPLFVQLSVRDVAASARWYQEALGFHSVYSMAGPDGKQLMNHLRLERYQDLMLVPQPPSLGRVEKGLGATIFVNYAGNLDVLAQKAQSQGGAMQIPEDTPWNTRQLTVTDPDGYVLAFSQVTDPDRSFEDVMGEAQSLPQA